MEIERINENTVKFYISYLDIEDRGFKREEIWYNRERSEQLFWQMMEELNYKEDFSVEGPLWIQVQALEKGLEVIVTRAQVSKNGETLDLLTENDMPVSNDETIEDIIERKFINKKTKEREKNNHQVEENFSMIVHFKDFEDVIQLSHSLNEVVDDITDTLYHYEGKYYLYMEFSQDIFDDDDQEDIISLVLEYAQDANITLHVLEEYGSIIFEDQTFAQVRSYFPADV